MSERTLVATVDRTLISAILLAGILKTEHPEFMDRKEGLVDDAVEFADLLIERLNRKRINEPSAR